MKTKQ
jgi:hypothetical protein